MNILEQIKEKAQSKQRRVLLVEGEDERMLKASVKAVQQNICIPVLLASKDVIVKSSSRLGLSLDGIDIMEHKVTQKDIDDLVELREHKGMTAGKAAELLKDPNHFGALKLKQGMVDGAIGGCKYSSADWMRPVFQIVGPKKGVSLISAVCFMIVKDKPYFFSDTDFVIVPTYQQIAQIAMNAAGFVRGVGIEPKVAMLSYSTHGSGEHESLADIRAALELVKKKQPELVVDGEMQFDAAINPDAAQRKCPDSPLKGEANTLIFPNITVGNVMIHALSQWTDYEFYGSFPVGLSKPVINGGRSFSPDDIYNALAACAMQCNSQ